MNTTSNKTDKSPESDRISKHNRPTILLPGSQNNKKSASKETSVDSGKSSRTSSRTSRKQEETLDLTIFGNAMLSNNKISSRSSDMNESRYDILDNQTTKKTRRNSLPVIINPRYMEAKQKHVQMMKKSHRKVSGTDTETKSPDYTYRENLSLDLSRMSDFADSEDETLELDKRLKQKSSKNQTQALLRRRRSVDKDKSSSRSGVPKSIPSSNRSAFTRRSSLQSFTPRSTLPRNSAYSSASPDYTSEPSTCDTSPCKLSPNNSVASSKTLMNRTSGLSSSSSCYTSWMERNVEGEIAGARNDSMEANISDADIKERGEWNSFWKNYNNSMNMSPKKFYDDCPTPFYNEQDPNQDKLNTNNTIEDTADEDNSDTEIQCIYISKNEAKEMIHCAHRLAEILTLALEKKSVKKTKEVKTEGRCNGESKHNGRLESKGLPQLLEVNEIVIDKYRDTSQISSSTTTTSKNHSKDVLL